MSRLDAAAAQIRSADQIVKCEHKIDDQEHDGDDIADGELRCDGQFEASGLMVVPIIGGPGDGAHDFDWQDCASVPPPR